MNKIDVLLGLQWGDEGKGKIVDFLARRYQVIARFQGGPNAGHTLYVGEKKVVLHTIPSGVLHSGCLNLIGNGVVIDPVTFARELDTVLPLAPDLKDRLLIARKAHLILPTHRALDAASEHAKGGRKIGSTLKGIGPCYMDKTGRNGIRVGDLFLPDFDTRYAELKAKHMALLSAYEYVPDFTEWELAFMESIERIRGLQTVDSAYWIDDQLRAGKSVLAEGAQGSMLDLDFGTYPYVTSSNTIASGVCQGLGVAPSRIGEVYGITKAYCTRVGSGPFPTELHGEEGQRLREAGHEFGATTGRPRRCGWMDLVALRYAIMLSGVTKLILTKADVLDSFDPLSVATDYLIQGQKTRQLPYDLGEESLEVVCQSFPGWKAPVSESSRFEDTESGFQSFIRFVEEYLNTPVAYVSNGTGRDQILPVLS